MEQRRRAAKLLGYTEEELRGIPFVDLIHPDDLGQARRAFAHDPGPAHAVRTRYRCKDGSWRWLEWTALTDTDTGLVYGAARDVTARQVAQGALAANEARLQAILDHSSAAIFVKDRVGRYTVVNDTFLRAFGFDGEQVLGKTVQEIWPGAEVDDIDQRVIEDGLVSTRDDVVDLPDGSHTILSVRFPLRDTSGRIAGMAAICTDVTEWTHVESALAERQRLLDTVIRACPDIVTVLDGDARVREVSEASARILGFDLSSPVHEEVEALVHPDDIEAVYREYAKVITDPDAPMSIRYRVRHADGHWIVLDTRGQTIVDDDGRAAGAVVVSRDVTDELEIEAQMHAAVEVAEHASTAKSEFLSRMSHELRTPLNSVLGFSQLLEMDGLPGQQGEAVGHIMRAGRHLLNLIDEVLDIARIESGNLELVMEPLSIHEVLRDAVDLVSPLAERRSIEVVADLDGTDEFFNVRADRKRLLQVLLNLLSNAVKYNRVGGRVDVSVAGRVQRRRQWTPTPTPGFSEPAGVTSCASLSPTPATASPPGTSNGSSSPSTAWGPRRPAWRGPAWASRCPSTSSSAWGAPSGCTPTSVRGPPSPSSFRPPPPAARRAPAPGSATATLRVSRPCASCTSRTTLPTSSSSSRSSPALGRSSPSWRPCPAPWGSPWRGSTGPTWCSSTCTCPTCRPAPRSSTP